MSTIIARTVPQVPSSAGTEPPIGAPLPLSLAKAHRQPSLHVMFTEPPEDTKAMFEKLAQLKKASGDRYLGGVDFRAIPIEVTPSGVPMLTFPKGPPLALDAFHRELVARGLTPKNVPNEIFVYSIPVLPADVRDHVGGSGNFSNWWDNWTKSNGLGSSKKSTYVHLPNDSTKNLFEGMRTAGKGIGGGSVIGLVVVMGRNCTGGIVGSACGAGVVFSIIGGLVVGLLVMGIN